MPSTVTAGRPLVLVADANPASSARRAEQLEEEGFRVGIARTAFAAIVKATCHQPHVVLVDPSLGEAGVADTVELIRRCPATAHIPVVRVTRGRRLSARVLHELRAADA